MLLKMKKGIGDFCTQLGVAMIEYINSHEGRSFFFHVLSRLDPYGYENEQLNVSEIWEELFTSRGFKNMIGAMMGESLALTLRASCTLTTEDTDGMKSNYIRWPNQVDSLYCGKYAEDIYHLATHNGVSPRKERKPNSFLKNKERQKIREGIDKLFDDWEWKGGLLGAPIIAFGPPFIPSLRDASFEDIISELFEVKH